MTTSINALNKIVRRISIGILTTKNHIARGTSRNTAIKAFDTDRLASLLS